MASIQVRSMMKWDLFCKNKQGNIPKTVEITQSLPRFVQWNLPKLLAPRQAFCWVIKPNKKSTFDLYGSCNHTPISLPESLHPLETSRLLKLPVANFGPNKSTWHLSVGLLDVASSLSPCFFVFDGENETEQRNVKVKDARSVPKRHQVICWRM